MLGKNPQNYEGVCNKISVYEQKPIKIDDFNKAEEKQIKERIEIRKIKRREIAENNELFKKKKELRIRQKDKAEMSARLGELNNEFKNIKNHKKIRK